MYITSAMRSESRLFKAVVVALVLCYGATLAIIGFSHIHLLLQSRTMQLDAARQGTSHDAAPTCIVCFRLNSSHPTLPDQQVFAGDLAAAPAVLANAVPSLCSFAVVYTDGRAPPVSLG